MRVLPFLLALACSSASPTTDGSFPADPYQTLTSDSGQLRVEVRTGPDQPPQHGLCSVELRFTDAKTGAPAAGDVAVVPWMPAHNHGASVLPSVAPSGPGRYTVQNLELFMPGTWELRTTLTGATSDHATPTLDVL
jgi:hypothetical protein